MSSATRRRISTSCSSASRTGSVSSSFPAVLWSWAVRNVKCNVSAIASVRTSGSAGDADHAVRGRGRRRASTSLHTRSVRVSVSKIALCSGVGRKSSSIRRMGSRAELARCLGSVSECYNVLYNTLFHAPRTAVLQTQPLRKPQRNHHPGRPAPENLRYFVVQTAIDLGWRALSRALCRLLRRSRMRATVRSRNPD